MRLILVSGLSGSGKSVALHMLEDLGFYCIDNIPAALLKPFISHTRAQHRGARTSARPSGSMRATPRRKSPPCRRSSTSSSAAASSARSLFLLAERRRAAAALRRDPPQASDQPRPRLACAKPSPSSGGCSSPSSTPPTWSSTPRAWACTTCASSSASASRSAAPARLSILFESFGFKHGIPGDADFVFDARSLPNPYWEPSLRALTGRDAGRRAASSRRSAACTRLIDDIAAIHRRAHSRVPGRSNRGYLTVAIGCTGGQHRSVYIAERLAERFAAQLSRHRDPPQLARRDALDHARSDAADDLVLSA